MQPSTHPLPQLRLPQLAVTLHSCQLTSCGRALQQALALPVQLQAPAHSLDLHTCHAGLRVSTPPVAHPSSTTCRCVQREVPNKPCHVIRAASKCNESHACHHLQRWPTLPPRPPKTHQRWQLLPRRLLPVALCHQVLDVQCGRLQGSTGHTYAAWLQLHGQLVHDGAHACNSQPVQNRTALQQQIVGLLKMVGDEQQCLANQQSRTIASFHTGTTGKWLPVKAQSHCAGGPLMVSAAGQTQ